MATASVPSEHTTARTLMDDIAKLMPGKPSGQVVLQHLAKLAASVEVKKGEKPKPSPLQPIADAIAASFPAAKPETPEAGK